MSAFFKSTMSLFETIGRARAASYLAQNGYHEEAKRLLTDV